ncbi:YbbC/YhhH family protein [Flavobacterium procerum]|uniref:YbbC/YhhH family protein n=1 Tax=Flavobacterium procerum TaxID=1455569 RepID=A0ABV6BL03_9FLAO
MKSKIATIFIAAFFLISCNDKTKSFSSNKIKKCDDCLVEKEETAIAIAEAILFERFGKDKIEDQKPYKINIKQDSIWVLKGSFNKIGFGGTFYIEISSKNAKILEIYHGK